MMNSAEFGLKCFVASVTLSNTISSKINGNRCEKAMVVCIHE